MIYHPEVKEYTNAKSLQGKKIEDFLARDIDYFFREKYKGFLKHF